MTWQVGEANRCLHRVKSGPDAVNAGCPAAWLALPLPIATHRPCPQSQESHPTASLPCSPGLFLSSCLPFLQAQPQRLTHGPPGPGALEQIFRKTLYLPPTHRPTPFGFRWMINCRPKFRKTLGLLAFFQWLQQTLPVTRPFNSTSLLPVPLPSWVRGIQKKVRGELLAPAAGSPRPSLLSSNPQQCSLAQTPFPWGK